MIIFAGVLLIQDLGVALKNHTVSKLIRQGKYVTLLVLPCPNSSFVCELAATKPDDTAHISSSRVKKQLLLKIEAILYKMIKTPSLSRYTRQVDAVLMLMLVHGE